MKKLFILSLVFSFITIAASAQKEPMPEQRSQRFRMEQGFRRGPMAQQRFHMRKQQFQHRFQHFQQHRFNRFGRMSPPMARNRQMMMRNRMNRMRMLQYRQHYYNNRRVI